MLWVGLWAENYEVRGVTNGVSKAGNPYMTIRVEDAEGNANEVSVTGDAIQQVNDLQLRKGDVVDMRLTIVTGRDRAYASLSRGAGSIIKQGNAYAGDLPVPDSLEY